MIVSQTLVYYLLQCNLRDFIRNNKIDSKFKQMVIYILFQIRLNYDVLLPLYF